MLHPVAASAQLLAQRAAQTQLRTRYYTAAVHHAAFALMSSPPSPYVSNTFLARSIIASTAGCLILRSIEMA